MSLAVTTPARSCQAPWTSLHLDPRGWVTACTVNKRDPIGHVHDGALIDLWRSERERRFRTLFDDGAVAPGCGLCRWQRESAGDAAMYARVYDHLAPRADADWPVHLELTLSSDCNLACAMCNGAFSSTIRRRREGLAPMRSPYGDEFFEQLPALLAHLHTTKFLGGEPFLAKENLRVWELMADQPERPACHVTTNGTVYTARVADVLAEVPMSIAVSMDGVTAPTVERIRSGADLGTILTNLDRFQDHVERHGTDLSLTFCLMVENWSELPDFLVFAEQRDLSVYVNTVVSPIRFSLYHLSAPQLAEVVDALAGSDQRMEVLLDRNLAVWRDQLHRLRHALAEPLDKSEIPVHLPALRRPPTLPIPANPTPVAAEEELARWSGQAGVGRLRVDADGRIGDVDADAVAGINLDRMAGLGIDELFLWLQSAYGRLDASHYLVHAPESGDRVLGFGAGDGGTEVRMISGADPDGGAWWRLAARPTPPDATADPTGSSS